MRSLRGMVALGLVFGLAGMACGFEPFSGSTVGMHGYPMNGLMPSPPWSAPHGRMAPGYGAYPAAGDCQGRCSHCDHVWDNYGHRHGCLGPGLRAIGNGKAAPLRCVLESPCPRPGAKLLDCLRRCVPGGDCDQDACDQPGCGQPEYVQPGQVPEAIEPAPTPAGPPLSQPELQPPAPPARSKPVPPAGPKPVPPARSKAAPPAGHIPPPPSGGTAMY